MKSAIALVTPRTLNRRILLYFLALFLSALGGILLVSLYGLPWVNVEGDIEEARRNRHAHLNLVVDAKKRQFELWLKERVADTLVLQESRAVLGFLTYPTPKNRILVRERLDRYLKIYDQMEVVGLVDPGTGVWLAQIGNQEGQILALRPDLLHHLMAADADHQLHLGPLTANDSDRLLVSRRIREAPGEPVLALLVTSVDINRLHRDVFAVTEREALGPSAEFILVSKQQENITPLKYLPGPNAARRIRLDDASTVMASSGFEGTVVTTDYRNVEVLSAFRHVRLSDSDGVGLVVKTDRAEILEPLRQRTVRLVGIGLVAALFVVLISALVARRITLPLVALGRAATQIQGGDLDVRSGVAGADEIGQVGRAFDDMASRLQQWHAELETELTRRQKKIQDEEGRMLALGKAAMDAIIALDEQGRVTYWNPAAELILGYGQEAALGRHFRRLVQGAEFLDKDESSSVSAAQGRLLERDLTGAGGRCFPAELAISSFVYGASVNRLLVLRDITERRQAREELERYTNQLETRVAARTEALQQANAQLQQSLDQLRRAQTELVEAEKLASLGRLVAGIAHELNTPIGNGVTLASSMDEMVREFETSLQEGGLRRSVLSKFTERMRQGVTLLLRSLGQAATLVSDFKQVAVDQTSSQRREFDLGVVVEEVAATLRPRFRTSPHKLSVDIPPGILLDSFPGPLGQVITNLVTNALAHAFDDRISGSLRIEAGQPDAGMVQIRITDDGIGIPADILPRIFEPFFTTKMGQGGSGLGLNIVYNIVVGILGGRISAVSSEGSGARFIIDLPLQAPKPAESATES